MKNEELIYILRILSQVGGPVNINYQTKQITLITEGLIAYHIKKIESFLKTKKFFYEEYSISDIFSLYMCLSFILNDLGVDEFETVLGEDFHTSGLKLLSSLKNEVLNYNH